MDEHYYITSCAYPAQCLTLVVLLPRAPSLRLFSFFGFLCQTIRTALALPRPQAGTALNYDEVAVYSEAAAIPTYLVVYTTD